MAKTHAKKTRTNPAKKDRHSTPVILTASGQLIATKKRIESFTKKYPDTRVVASEIHHYAMLRFLRVAKDEDGTLHICTTTVADENGWDIVVAKEVRHG